MSAYDGKTTARIVPTGHSEESLTIEFSVFGDNVARLRSMLEALNGRIRVRSATEVENGGSGDVSQAMDTILGFAEGSSEWSGGKK
jgi:hypothetical protein